MLKEFKEFAMRGNVIDLAAGVIIGGAFGKIVTSLVNDIIMPPVGLLLGGVDFKDLFIVLKPAAGNNLHVVLRYGLFINTLIDFLIVAFSIFIMISLLNKIKKKEAAKPDEKKITKQEELLTEIRDLLKKRK